MFVGRSFGLLNTTNDSLPVETILCMCLCGVGLMKMKDNFEYEYCTK